MTPAPVAVLERLRRKVAAPERPRVLVSSGGCSRAVGSEAVLQGLRAELKRRGPGIEVVAAGCDGACHQAVAVTAMHPGERPRRWDRVEPGDVGLIVDAVLDPAAPVARPSYDPTETSFLHRQRRVLLACVGWCDPVDAREALQRGRYKGLARALSMTPDEVIDEIAASGVAGRGGAYFPLATKWCACRDGGPGPRAVVVNAEEGEPGVIKDRHLMEGDPHLLIEGFLIAAYAVDAPLVTVYLNGMADVAEERLQAALANARELGLIGRNILGTQFGCEVEIRLGAGGYVLGEESVILESIEGRRPMPRVRPPFPTTAGLHGRPTAINNVESLCNAAIVLEFGGDAFHQVGSDRWPGTKLISLTGDVRRPGLVEVEIGSTLRQLVEELGGGVPPGRRLQAILTGGPSGMLVPPALLDRPLAPRDPEVLLGSGNVIVFDNSRDLLEIVRRLTWFNAHESCGKCTPCREGVHQLATLLDRAARRETSPTDRADLDALIEIASSTSICGLGQMAPNPIRSALTWFGLPGLEGREENGNAVH